MNSPVSFWPIWDKIVYSVAKCFPEIKLSTRWSVAERLSTLSQHLNHRVENVIKQLVHTSAVRSSRYEASGKFGEHERCVRVAREVAESNSSFLSIYPICIRQTKFQPFFLIFHFEHFSVFLVTSSSPVWVVIAYPWKYLWNYILYVV